ncbi:P-loop containing nucleoside triphosphate hydrolase protein, partial [Pavlovales sp. CCMP2436]
MQDMQKLNYLHEPALLHNLSHRFARDHVYTYTGKICISINPFNWDVSTPLYTQERLLSYRGAEVEVNDPHVYAIAERAYTAILKRNAHAGGSNQSILVSGESGAGKTEAVKIMMGFLAKVSGKGAANTVAERVMESNPLLEAFGNARTLRNDNSSRFGKFIELQFDASSKMCGACIHIYLLEKTRVTGQQLGERNYHAFYQLLAGSDEDARARLQLKPPEAYAYVSKSGCLTIAGVDDAKDYARVCTAMRTIGLSAEEVVGSWALVSAVLALSNLHFEPDPTKDGAARVCDDARQWLGAAAAAAGCESADDLSAALCTRQICARDEWYTVRLTVEQAGDSRDALAKALYGRLFEWLVVRVNACLNTGETGALKPAGAVVEGGGGRTSELFVGILDIFGFECFVKNSFEQLCINYANERLQQQFNWDIFKAEQVEYESEGIEWAYIEFTDNAKCLALIDAKPLGVLHVLNE